MEEKHNEGHTIYDRDFASSNIGRFLRLLIKLQDI